MSILDKTPEDLTGLEQMREEEVNALRRLLRRAHTLLKDVSDSRPDHEQIKEWLAMVRL